MGAKSTLVGIANRDGWTDTALVSALCDFIEELGPEAVAALPQFFQRRAIENGIVPDASPHDYRLLRAWCRLVWCSDEQAERRLAEAVADNAPADALFYSVADNRWVRYDEITARNTREDLERILAELD